MQAPNSSRRAIVLWALKSSPQLKQFINDATKDIKIRLLEVFGDRIFPRKATDLELHDLAQFEDADVFTDRVQNVLPFIEQPIIMFSAAHSETSHYPKVTVVSRDF
jgi:hypothetical protein